MNSATNQPTSAVLESARLLRQLHTLFVQGIEEGAEADSIRDEMEAPWYDMTTQERDRMGGLSEDLYSLANGGPPCVAMSGEQILAWKKELEKNKVRYVQGDIDAWLTFWRKPRPNNLPHPNGVPLSVVHFFQAQCWDKLKDYETAAMFMKAAEKLDPSLSGLVLHSLNLAGDYGEAKRYANRILGDPKTAPAFVCMAASILLGRVDRGARTQIISLCNRLVPILSAALEKERKSQLPERELPETEDYLVNVLGMCLEILGKDQQALALYERALKTRPRNPDLYLRRGIVLLYFRNDPAAFDDFEKAIQLGSTRCLPFLLIAQKEFNEGQYWDAYRRANQASDKKGTKELLSLAHQIIAMALAMNNQNIDWVKDNFRLAERFDPNNPTISQNRAIAMARYEKQESIDSWKLDRPEMIDFAETQPDQFDAQFNRRMEEMISVA